MAKYDDPILKGLADSYYSEFEIADENAELEPLKPDQILLLDKYLQYVEEKIEKYRNKDNKEEIQKIKNDVSD